MKLANPFNGIRALIDRVLGHTHHHYRFVLPSQSASTTDFLLDRLFSGIVSDPKQIDILRGLPENAVVMYVTKHKSNFEKLLYHHRFRRLEVPFPTVTFNYRTLFWLPVHRLCRSFLAHVDHFLHTGRLPDPIVSGYVNEALLDGQAAFMSLLERREFHRRFVHSGHDPLQLLIRLQKETGRPVFIVPLLLFFDRKPTPASPAVFDLFFGSANRPGKLRHMMALIRKPGKIFFEVAEPLNLETYLRRQSDGIANSEQAAMALRLELLARINSHRHVITGPGLKSRTELEQQILTSERMQAFMARYTARRNIDTHKARKEAVGYLNEIAARLNPAIIQIGLWVVRSLSKTMFDGVTVNEDMLSRLKIIGSRNPIIFVPCHKSHMDSLLVSSIQYTHHMQAPLIFAGKNLAFWPMGPFLRRLGAFFVRRSFKGAVFYATVLSEYIHRVLAEGHNIEVFIEGTRSRSGKLLPPQVGMISILLNAVKAGACRDLSFVPVAINYDRVPEEGAYLHEVEGGQKEPENFRQMLRARKALKMRYGRVYVNFSEPVTLSDMLDAQGCALTDMSTHDQNRLSRAIAGRILNAIDTATVITPHGLAAAAILCSRQTLTEPELIERVDIFMNGLNAREAPLADTLAMDVHRAVNQVIADYERRRYIESTANADTGREGERRWRIPSGRRAALEFYKNNVLIPLIPMAFTALLILEKEAFQFSAEDLHDGYDRLADLFADEFNFDAEAPSAYLVRKTVKYFIDEAALIPHAVLPDTYNLTAQGFRKLALYAGLLKPFLEAYLVVASYQRRGKKGRDAHRKDQLKRVRHHGLRMYKAREVSLREALNLIYYSNALSTLQRIGIRDTTDPESRDRLADFESRLRRYLGVIHG